MTLLNFYLWNQADGTDSIAHSIIILWLVSVTHQSNVVKLFICALITGFSGNILPVLQLREPILPLSRGHLLVLQQMHSQHSYDPEFSQSAVHLLTRLHLMFKVFVGFKVCSMLYYLDVCKSIWHVCWWCFIDLFLLPIDDGCGVFHAYQTVISQLKKNYHFLLRVMF